MDSAQRSLRARIGAFALHAHYDARETTAAARSAFLAKFEDEVDPGRALPDAERQRRAEYAKKAYFSRIRLASSRKRSRKQNAGSKAEPAAAIVVAGGKG